MSGHQLVPFGKYRGEPIEKLELDREYCQWLLAQTWLEAKYPEVHTLIINNFGEPEDTPEHNRMQANSRVSFIRESEITEAQAAGFMAEEKGWLPKSLTQAEKDRLFDAEAERIAGEMKRRTGERITVVNPETDLGRAPLDSEGAS